MTEVRVPEPSTGSTAQAAFFDVDNTLVRGASVYLLAKGLYARGFFGSTLIVRAVWYHLIYKLAGERHRHMDAARASILSIIEGRTVAEITQAADEIYDELIGDRLWPGTVALAQAHLAAGDQVWLVTAAPAEVAEVIVRRLGFTGALGSRAETKDGHYTGRLIDGLLHGTRKAEAVRDLAAAEQLSLADCYAYSDSRNDLPLLDSVGHPTAINPDRRLRQRARHNGWPIRDFRRLRRWVRYGFAVGLGAAMAWGGLTLLRRTSLDQGDRGGEHGAA